MKIYEELVARGLIAQVTDEDEIICLCCLGKVEKGDYKIVERNINMGNTSIDKLLCEELYDYNEMGD